MQGACGKNSSSLLRDAVKCCDIFVFNIFVSGWPIPASMQVTTTRWTCSGLVVNQRSEWRQKVDDNRPIGACPEHGLANPPQ